MRRGIQLLLAVALVASTIRGTVASNSARALRTKVKDGVKTVLNAQDKPLDINVNFYPTEKKPHGPTVTEMKVHAVSLKHKQDKLPKVEPKAEPEKKKEAKKEEKKEKEEQKQPKLHGVWYASGKPFMSEPLGNLERNWETVPETETEGDAKFPVSKLCASCSEKSPPAPTPTATALQPMIGTVEQPATPTTLVIRTPAAQPMPPPQPRIPPPTCHNC